MKFLILLTLILISNTALSNVIYEVEKNSYLELEAIANERFQIRNKGVVDVSFLRDKKIWRIIPLKAGTSIIKREYPSGELIDVFMIKVLKENSKQNERWKRILCEKNLVICRENNSILEGSLNDYSYYSKIYKKCLSSLNCAFKLKLSSREKQRLIRNLSELESFEKANLKSTAKEKIS